MSTQRHDERTAAVLWTGGSFVAIVAIAIAAAVWLGAASRRPPLAGAAVEQRVHAFPQPRLERAPAASSRALAEQREALLQQCGWIDRERGVCRVPVEWAIDVLLARHFELSR